MRSDFIEDRGPAEYFHGRQEIIDTFTSVLKRYRAKKGGTTFLVQGAPGAGKTALLDVLSEKARGEKWAVATINLKDLHNPASMAQSLDKSYNIDKQVALSYGVEFLGRAHVKRIQGSASSEDILRNFAPRRGLILVLDEAQYLGNLNDTPTEKHLVRDTLDMIHNGGFGKPIMLLAAGLGTTESAFNSLGISRFARNCIVGLGPLDRESERAAIRDWIVKEGAAKGNPDPWIDAIAKETHGWPQHIISYIEPAVRYLESNNRQMTDEGLRIVLEKGAEFRLQYYRQRARGIDKRKRQVLAKTFSNSPLGETMEIDDIKSSFEQEYSKEEADNLFDKALKKGIIDERDDGDYGIPIPSMQAWLIEEYGREQVDIPEIANESPKQEKDASKWSRER